MSMPNQTAFALIEEHETNDPFELCDLLGILVLSSDLPESVQGFSANIKNNNIIYLNNLLDYPMDKQVCAHELGHILMHPHHNLLFMMEHTLFVHQRYEREADEFCAALLFRPEEMEDFTSLGQFAESLGVEERIAKIMLSKVAPEYGLL